MSTPYNLRREKRYPIVPPNHQSNSEMENPNDSTTTLSGNESDESSYNLDILTESDINVVSEVTDRHYVNVIGKQADVKEVDGACASSTTTQHDIETAVNPTIPPSKEKLNRDVTSIDTAATTDMNDPCYVQMDSNTNANVNATPDLSLIFNYLQQMNQTMKTKFNETKSEIHAQLNETKSEIHAQLNDTKSEIHTQLTETKSEIRAQLTETIETKLNQTETKLIKQINECKLTFTEQIDDIKTRQTQLDDKLDNVGQAQIKHCVKLSNFQVEIRNEIKQNQTQTHELIKDTIEQNTNTIETKISQENALLVNHVHEQLNQHKTEINQVMKNNEIESKLTAERIAQAYTNTLQNQLQPQIQEQARQIEGLHDVVSETKSKIDNLGIQSKAGDHSLGTVQVICTGNENAYIERQLPKFNGRAINPNEYLEKMKRYYEKSLNRTNPSDPIEHLKDLVELSLENHASRWFQLIKSDVKSWESFASEFLSKYWSKEVQRGIRSRIENEKFRTNGTLNRTEYFTERVLMLQSIQPPLSEDEIVACLSNRFEQILQDSVCVQNISTIREFEKLLQREDIREGQQRSRTNNHMKNNEHDNNHQRQKHNTPFPQRPDINPQAYQPKRQYHNNNNQHHNYRPYNYFNDNGNRNQRDFDNRNWNNRPSNYERNNRSPQRSNRADQPNQAGSTRRYPTQEQAQLCAILGGSSSHVTGTQAQRSSPPSSSSSPSHNSNQENC